MNRAGRYWVAVTMTATILLSVMFVSSARAGCLIEYEDCAACAQTALKRAMWRLDFGGIRRANFMMYDCAIDLYHCTVLADHHSYPCSL